MSEVRKGSMGTILDHGGAELKWNVNSFWQFEKWYGKKLVIGMTIIPRSAKGKHVHIHVP